MSIPYSLSPMQNFALLHDGSVASWNAAYAAFYIATRLGAPLHVFLANPEIDKNDLSKQATQLEISGRAASVTIDTHLIADFSLETLTTNIIGINGLFAPRQIIKDGKFGTRITDTFTCPVWSISQLPKAYKMATLVDRLTDDDELIQYTASLSVRLQAPMIRIVQGGFPGVNRSNDNAVQLVTLPDLSPANISAALEEHQIELLFLPASKSDLLKDWAGNCILFPAPKGA